jgi:hypothetical protein
MDTDKNVSAFVCHSERSEESRTVGNRKHHAGFFAALRMTESGDWIRVHP